MQGVGYLIMTAARLKYLSAIRRGSLGCKVSLTGVTSVRTLKV